jgi:hypothetical protein
MDPADRHSNVHRHGDGDFADAGLIAMLDDDDLRGWGGLWRAGFGILQRLRHR